MNLPNLLKKNSEKKIRFSYTFLHYEYNYLFIRILLNVYRVKIMMRLYINTRFI